MSSQQKTKSLLSCELVADTETVDFCVRGGINTVAIQVNYVECAVSASIFVDEDVCLACDTITDVAHGFDTGLEGQLSVQTGATSVFNCEDVDVSACMDCITEAAHDLTTGESGQLTRQRGCPSTTGFAAFAVCCCTLTITEACHCYIKGERGEFTTSCADLPAGLALITPYFVTNVTACTYDLSSTRALAIACCSDLAVTDQGSGCHTFTPDGELPDELCAGVDYFIIDNGVCTYQLATSRVNALAGTAIDIITLQSPASITWTANGVIHDCLTTCACMSFIIRVDDDTYQIASTRALATAGTALDIVNLGGCCSRSPASVTFTAAATGCTSGTVCFFGSVDGVNFPCAALPCTQIVMDGCAPANINTLTQISDVGFNVLRVVVTVTCGQFTLNINATGKE